MRKIPCGDLVEHFKLTCEEADGYCSQGEKNYLDWENNIAKPAMIAAGFSDIHFITTDGDSFGPLVRRASCKDANGNRHHFFYG